MLGAAGVLAGCSDSGETSNNAGGSSAQSGGAATAGQPSAGAATSGATSSGGTGATASGGVPGEGGSGTTGGGEAGGTGGSNGGASAGTGGGGAGSSGGAASCGLKAGGAALAFPGAQGFGRNVTGGRAGTVYHVTNLNDSGAGSFRDAVSKAGRIVVFDVGGYIQLKTAVSAQGNLTIAGQTAPGGGIGFRGGEISFAGRSNIIMRHVRVRPGDETADDTDDALSLYQARDVILDHCSFEFAPWNNIDGVSSDWQTKPVTNISFQDNIIANPTGQQFGAHCESVASDWSWYRNLFANSHNRNPLAKTNTIFVNNLEYDNQASYTTHTSTSFKHDIVNNYFIYGPAGSTNTWFQIDPDQSIYSAGNLLDSDKNGALNGTTTIPSWYNGTGTILQSAWSPLTGADAMLDAPSAARAVMSRAGALPRDPIDSLVLSQVMTLGNGTKGTGAGTAGNMYTSQTQTGLDNNGYGTIASGTKPADADNDGMPDDWEKALGSDPKVDDAMKKASDGYALIEQYINWLAEPHATTRARTAVTVDLSALTLGFSKVSPTFTVANAQNGTVTLGADGHTATLTPSDTCYGLASFSFTVTGSDKTTFTDDVVVLVTP